MNWTKTRKATQHVVAARTAIEGEFTRIGATALGPCSSICVDVQSGPERKLVARYWDDYAQGFAFVDELLSALRSLPDDYCADFEDTDFWQSFPENDRARELFEQIASD